MSKSRETELVELPSGKEAEIYTYLTRGDIKFIDEYRWGDAHVKQEEAGQVRIEDIPVTQAELEKDALVLRGVKCIVDGDDETKMTKKLLEAMDIRDFNFLETELRKKMAGKKK